MSAALEAVIAGAGVAGLETAFALQAMAGERVSVTVIAPEPDFVYRPMVINEPFADARARRYELPTVVSDAGAELVCDAFHWLDHVNRVVHTTGGKEIGYDALVLALGARRRAHFKHALTLDERKLHEQLSGVVGEIDEGVVRSVALLVASASGWPLPIYELALHIGKHARDHGIDVEVTIVTPEQAPLAIFGAAGSRAVGELLDEEGIRINTSVSCEVPEPGVVSLRPGLDELRADCVIALPQLYGPSTPGVPKRARGGFLAIDPFCRVRDVPGVYAVGDASDFPVKFGAVAAQHGDTAAASIGAAAGAPVEAEPFNPIVHGMLLGGARPLHVSAHLVGSHGHYSHAGASPALEWQGELRARYLAPYLEASRPAAAR